MNQEVINEYANNQNSPQIDESYDNNQYNNDVITDKYINAILILSQRIVYYY